jgi:hypothetical protein
VSIKILDGGPANDRQLDTLEGELLPRVHPERGLDLATYAGYSYIKPKLVGTDVARLSVFGTRQEIGYRVIADNRTANQAKVRFRICVRDSADKSLAEPTTIEVLSGPGETTARRICFSLDLNGTYVLAWGAQTGQLSFEGESHFAVVPPEERELAATSPFGLHAGHCRMLEAANMRWVRNGQIVFAEELSDQENREWTTFEQVLHAAEQHGITLICVIQCNSTKRWTAKPLKDYSRFRVFVRDLVAEFKSRQKVWEIVNEPNVEGFSSEQYIKALEAGYLGAKEADPECTLMMGGTSRIDMPYIKRLGELGLGGLCDVISVHPYYPAEPPEGKLLSKLQELRAWRDDKAAGKSMWSTEIAWETGGEHGVDGGTLRDYLVRSSILQLAHAQEMVLWSIGADRQWSPPWVKSGLYRGDLTPKDTFVAFAALSRLLAGKRFIGSAERGKGVFALRFEGPGECIEALWRADGQSEEVTVPIRRPCTLLDIFANRLDECSTGELQVAVGPTPVFMLEQQGW